MNDVGAVANAFHRACSAVGVPYAFIGGIAVMAWGRPRATMDVDALIRMRTQQAQRFAAALAVEGLSVSPEDLVAAVAEGSHVSIFASDGILHIDAKPARGAVEEAQVDQAVAISLGGEKPRFSRPEETVAFKLLFGTPLDIDDARSIIVRQADALDWHRLEEIAAALGVKAELERLREAGDAGPGQDIGH